MSLPKDPNMLLSLVNMKLRDGSYDGLSDFCSSMDIDESDLVARLHDAGFEYNENIKQFR